MRLVRQVRRLEGAAAARALEREPVQVGLAWTEAKDTVEAAGLVEGEYIACDIHVCDESQDGVTVIRTTERVTHDARDLGAVYLSEDSGTAVGRVTAIDGTLITYELFEDEPA